MCFCITVDDYGKKIWCLCFEINRETGLPICCTFNTTSLNAYINSGCTFFACCGYICLNKKPKSIPNPSDDLDLITFLVGGAISFVCGTAEFICTRIFYYLGITFTVSYNCANIHCNECWRSCKNLCSNCADNSQICITVEPTVQPTVPTTVPKTAQLTDETDDTDETVEPDGTVGTVEPDGTDGTVESDGTVGTVETELVPQQPYIVSNFE